MRNITAADFNEMTDGEQIPGIEGIMEEVYKPHSGTGGAENKPYTIQNARLKVDGQVMRVVIKNTTVPLTLRGKLVRFECTKSDKHGLVGVKVKMDKDANGKLVKAVYVTGTAKVFVNGEVIGGDAGGQEPEPQNAPAPAPTPQPAARRQAPAPEPEPRQERTAPEPPREPAPEPPLTIKAEVNKMANLWIICARAAAYASEVSGLDLTPEQSQTLATTFFIQSCRRGGDLRAERGDMREPRD